MKSFLLFLALLGALTLSSFSTSVTSAANAPEKEQAVVTFSEPTTVMGVTLKGEYLFVHDDAAMARGEACTYIYKGRSAVTHKLAASFHCLPALRAKVDYFTVRTLLTSPGEYQVTEYQFAGSTEAHVVPMSPHTGHVHLTN